MQTHLDRDDLHLLPDCLPDGEVATARKSLRAPADPLEPALMNAPCDDEPISAHEQIAWDADERRRLSGAPPVSHEDLLNEPGISESDLR